MIDTHAHIYDEQFQDDLSDMIDRAKALGITQIWMPNCASETIQSMLSIEKSYPDYCKSMMGLHPAYVKEDYKVELANIKKELEARKYIMIGEIGLDFYWDLTFIKEQEEVFLEQLALAKKYDLPICIHSRNSKNNEQNAILRCCELIEQFGWKDLRGVFHCFSGNLEEAKKVLSLNFLLGIGGVATFKNGGIDKFLEQIPLQKIVLETDSPYLAPVPFRGKRNEPSYLEYVVNKLSDIYKMDQKEIIRFTTQNALTLIQ